MVTDRRKIIFEKKFYVHLISLCVNALPDKAYGIVAGQDRTAGQGGYKVEEIYPLQTNLRLDNEKIDKIFQSYGEFYCDKDRGFWIDKREQFKVLKLIQEKGLRVIAIYHSHRCRLATPSQVDIDLHYDPNVLALIISVVNSKQPEVKAFEIANDRFHEIEIIIKSSKRNSVKEKYPLS